MGQGSPPLWCRSVRAQITQRPQFTNTSFTPWARSGTAATRASPSCYLNSLRLATEHELASVAFPGISTGIYGYPKKEAAAIAVHRCGSGWRRTSFPKR